MSHTSSPTTTGANVGFGEPRGSLPEVPQYGVPRRRAARDENLLSSHIQAIRTQPRSWRSNASSIPQVPIFGIAVRIVGGVGLPLQFLLFRLCERNALLTSNLTASVIGGSRASDAESAMTASNPFAQSSVRCISEGTLNRRRRNTQRWCCPWPLETTPVAFAVPQSLLVSILVSHQSSMIRIPVERCRGQSCGGRYLAPMCWPRRWRYRDGRVGFCNHPSLPKNALAFKRKTRSFGNWISLSASLPSRSFWQC